MHFQFFAGFSPIDRNYLPNNYICLLHPHTQRLPAQPTPVAETMVKAEKAFQSLKGIIKIQPIRHWLYNRVTAHVFICYLAYLLLSLLNLRLKPLETSPVEALRELDSLYKVYMRDSKKGFKLARMVALSKKQEKILRTIEKRLIPKM